jgi:signal transduction histidine kinase/CheY-like chemotaxis protein
MKRLTTLSYLLIVIIVAVNYIYYNNLYQLQIGYIKNLLGQQVNLIGAETGEVNLYFESDINKIFFEEKKNINNFFSDEYSKERITERLKFFYSKYEDLIVNIEINNTQSQVFNLYKEEDEWIPNEYISQTQKPIVEREMLSPNRDKYDSYYVIINSDDEVIGNMIVTVDYIKYFSAQFSKYKLEDFQWQWLIDDEGNILYINYLTEDFLGVRNSEGIDIQNSDAILNNILEGISGNLVHTVTTGDIEEDIISSYYPVTLLKRDFGMVFSAPTNFYQTYIIKNSLLIVTFTVLMVALLILFFRRHIRRQTEYSKLLKESEQTFIRLIEQMPVGVVIMNHNKEILKVNETVSKLFSYEDVSEMEGKLMPENIHSGEGLFFAENLGAGYEPNQFMVIKKGGVDIVIYRKEIPVRYNSDDATMVVLIDVTLLEVARKQEARANEAKSEFLSRISHEIRTPLNGIIGMADILADLDQTKKSQDIVNLIRNSSDLLLGIINDLLDFSRIEAGSLMLDEIPFDVRQEIDYCINIAGTSKAESVVFSKEVSSNVPESLIGDPFRLRQVLSSLLTISVEHTRKGKIEIGCNIEKTGPGIILLKFDIKDTGCGYSSAAFKKMFGDYIRAEAKTMVDYEGKGLTGVISKQLIEMMGGDLIPSTPSGLSDDPDCPGAHFVFTVKVYSNIRQEKNSGAAEIKSYKEIKTLVVGGGKQRDEDLLNSLQKIGLSTYVTSWQKQTINLIKSNLSQEEDKYRFIIILDTEDFDGFEVGKEIWENELFMDVIILMLSSNDQRGNYSRSIHCGIDDYLVKPFHISELFDIIQLRFPNIEPLLDSEIDKALSVAINILVVEDNLINQRVATTIFQSLGYDVDMASNGEEAIKMVDDKKYDIIFMDLIMPVIDGFEASRSIIEKDKDALIIPLTADSTTESVKKAELSGMQGFVTKPVKQQDIKRVLLSHFS